MLLLFTSIIEQDNFHKEIPTNVVVNQNKTIEEWIYFDLCR